MRVLVCGGRKFDDYAAVDFVLCELNRKFGLTHVIHGGAKGADSLAGGWANECGVQEVVCPANWDLNGRRAGPIRNAAMLGLGPDLVVAFPGGRGTADMVKQAKKAGVPVERVA